MASCVTGSVLLFAFIGGITGSCVDDVEDNVVPVCTDCTRTGKVVRIDTSMVPTSANVSCTCQIAASVMPTAVTIAYDGPNYTPCSIAFDFISHILSCKMDGNVSVEAPSYMHFWKGDYQGPSKAANLSVSAEQTNVTVTVICRNMTEQPNTTSLPISTTTTRAFSQTKQSTLQSSPGESSPIITATTTIAVSQPTLTTQNTLKNKTMRTQSQELESNEENQTVIIAGACGGTGGILLLIFLTFLLLYLYRSRVRNPSADIPMKVAYLNSASGNVVTENVVYNMEFSDETKYSHKALDETKVMCNSLPSDTQLRSDATKTVATYQNLQADNDEESFDANKSDSEHQKHNIPTVTQLDNQQLEEDGAAYNTVDFEDTTEVQTKGNSKSQQSSEIDSDPFYDTVGQQQNAVTSINANKSISTTNQKIEATYVVVNKTKPNDIGNKRPKQFQVPESDDTYALVNKESVK